MRASKAILCFRIIKYYDFAIKMMIIAEETLPSYINLTILMFTLILIYALIGMEFFRRTYDTIHNEKGQLKSFETIPQAWITVFDISTNDDWFTLMELGSNHANEWITALYLFIMIYLINHLTFGLVLAIILDGF